jgi:hypothetical protein
MRPRIGAVNDDDDDDEEEEGVKVGSDATSTFVPCCELTRVS